MDVELSARRTGLLLAAIAGALVALHVAAMLAWYLDWLPLDDWLYYSFFDLDEEESLGTWFSALLLLLAAVLSWLQGRLDTGLRRWWWLLAAGFSLLSLDEVAGFHEFVNTVVEDTHWTTFGAAIGLLVGLSFIPFLLKLPSRTRWLCIVGGVLYLGGAVGVERGTLWYEEQDLLDTLEYNLWNALEEGLEMGGIVVYVFALLERVAGVRARIGVVVSR